MNKIKPVMILLLVGCAAFAGWYILKSKLEPLFELGQSYWCCWPEGCDGFTFDFKRWSGIEWEYYLGYPEDVWVKESDLVGHCQLG